MSWLSALSFLKPFIAPIARFMAGLAAYFKGRNEGAKNEKTRARKKDDKIIDKGLSAGRDASNSGKLHDKHFRD